MSELTMALAQTKTLQANVTVTAATNAAPIAITTSANHNLVTGDIVQITGVTGNTSANGQFVITKTGATTFTLNNSVGQAAYVSGGTGVHVGFATPALLIDNTVFAVVPDFTLQCRIESLSQGSNARLHLEDAADSAFVTAEPIATFQQAGPVASNFSADAMYTAKRYASPDLRIGSSGDNIRTKVFISGGPGSAVQFSSWLTY